MKVIEGFQAKNTAAVLFAGAILCIFVQLNVSEIQIEILKASVKPAYHEEKDLPRSSLQKYPEKRKETENVELATVAIMTTVTASTETNKRLAVLEKLEFDSQRTADDADEDDIFPELHIEELEEEIDPTEAPTEAPAIQSRVSQI